MSKDFSMSVNLLRNDSLIKRLVGAGGEATPAMAKGLYEEGQLGFRDSQKQVPYRKGILKGSGRLFQPTVSGDRVDVTLGYGGAARKYAAPVHDLNKNYRKGKKWHYLSDPINKRAEGMDRRMAKRIERILSEGAS